MRPFRFGVNMVSISDRAEWVDKCQRAERLGYDVILVADHLGMQAPFPALVAAAAATERPRVGTFVLNTGFWNPTLLAREVATADQLTGGRLELGLGTGYVRAEFEQAGLSWESAGTRVDHLEHTVAELDKLLGGDDHTPSTVQRPVPPLLLGGNGDRMLRLAATRADVASFTGAAWAPENPAGLRLLDVDELAGRVGYFHARAGERAPEMNILVQQVNVTHDRRAAAGELHQQLLEFQQEPVLTVDQLLEMPTLLIGTVDEIAGQLRAHRERFGFSYITVLEPYMDTFAPIVEALAGS